MDNSSSNSINENDSDCDEISDTVIRSSKWTRPSTCAELQMITDEDADLHGLSDIKALTQLETESLSSPSYETLSVNSQKCEKILKRLLCTIRELLQTELTYVNDLQCITTLLHDYSFGVYESVRNFVSSSSFSAFQVAIECATAIGFEFLRDLEDELTQIGTIESSPSENFLPLILMVEAISKLFIRHAPLLTQYRHIIRYHNPIITLYSSLYENPDFKSYVGSLEDSRGHSFLSLSIKPVQRLPRYILFTKEIINTLNSLSESDVHVEHNPIILRALKSMKNANTSLSDCAVGCNNAMRKYEDLSKLHIIDAALKRGDGQKFSVVHPNRECVTEGVLRRHHKRSGMKAHNAYLFSDCLLIASSIGKSLILDIVIPLGMNCGTQCMPMCTWIQSASDAKESSCGIVILGKKPYYFMANHEEAKNIWIRGIQSVLYRNEANFDVIQAHQCVKITNTLVTLCKIHECDLVANKVDKSKTRSAIYLQANWWKLLHILEHAESSCPKELSASVSRIRNDVVKLLDIVHERVEKCFQMKNNCSLMSLFDSGPIGSYPIACGYMYDVPKKNTTLSSPTELVRPTILKVFLFSDVLLVGTVNGQYGKDCRYYFHIPVQDIAVRSMTNDPDGLGILLVDTGVVNSRSLVSSLWNNEIRERVILASSVSQKVYWISLLTETIRARISSKTDIDMTNVHEVTGGHDDTWKYSSTIPN